MPIHQASAIPYRRVDDRLEVCLITSLKKKRWMFPKGIIDPGETYAETALKEAYEEAGLHGRIEGEPLGTYEYFKWGTTLDVTVVVMHVLACDDDWPESELRQRRWVPADEAIEVLSREDLKSFLQQAVDFLGPPDK